MIERFKYKHVTECSMEEILQQLRQKEEIENICQKHSLNIAMLKPLFNLSMRGYNKTEIARKMGIHRVTVQRYSASLQSLTESEFVKIRGYILSIQQNGTNTKA